MSVMDVLCAKKDSWSTLPKSEKLQLLKEYINGVLKELGHPPANVVEGDLSASGNLGEWDKDANTVTIDSTHLESGSFKDTLDTATHEAVHAHDDHTTPGGVLLIDDVKDDDGDSRKKTKIVFNDDGTSDVVDPEDLPNAVSHQGVYDFAEDVAKIMTAQCKAQSTPYSPKNNLKPNDWVLT